ncbi:MAG: SET domain-containing protein [Parcubacteria group bacterium]|jgi:hypothetical protein
MKKVSQNNNKKDFSWINSSLEVRDIAECGKGVFALSDIKKDELLAIFGGYVMDVREEDDLPEYMNDYALQIHENFVLGIIKEEEIFDTDFFNHSCDPNAGFGGQIFLVAMRNIEAGEEVVFDYAMVLHKSRGVKAYEMKCLCKKDNCRGVITENDWKIPQLQKKYNGYFQHYLQKKINI